MDRRVKEAVWRRSRRVFCDEPGSKAFPPSGPESSGDELSSQSGFLFSGASTPDEAFGCDGTFSLERTSMRPRLSAGAEG